MAGMNSINLPFAQHHRFGGGASNCVDRGGKRIPIFQIISG
jgi:hypothetical protein